MILRFPSIEVLRLALTSGVIAQEVQCTPVRMAREADQAVLIQASRLSRPTLAELKKLGVEIKRSLRADFQSLVSWHQALPVTTMAADDPSNESSEVLFEMDGTQQLPVIVNEMMRLGNDRQSFRHVGENGTAKTLLRVTAPPYYTMLRAVDQSSTDVPITAYVQQSPRVWVQVGSRHPLGDRLHPPVGKWLLITADNRWRFLTEGAFRDVYEVLEFNLPDAVSSFTDCEPSDRIKIPMELAMGSRQEAAELWVLNVNAMDQVEKLIRRSDDRLISRLAFAVAESDHDADPTVIIRARPSKQLPPVLVLDAVACRPYLKIPNLFLPLARRLHPPLRRDAVVKLLAQQSDQITWLVPREARSFVPQSIPDQAFRPMSDWVDYVIDHQSKPLQVWVASHQFDFEHFVCREDADKRKPSPPNKPARKSPQEVNVDAQAPDIQVTSKRIRRKPTDDSAKTAFAEPAAKKTKHDQLQLRLRQLERDFQQSEEPIDSHVRTSIWKEMAITNAELQHRFDATVCWVNALWCAEVAEASWLDQWLRCEQHCSHVGSLTRDALDKLISGRGARSAEPTLIAAYLVWAASREPTPAVISDRRSELAQYLQHQENYLPVRAAWLAWYAMYKMSGNDVLMLARARDRLLERLFNHGLTPEFDMAAFMRSGGVGVGDRFRVLRDQLLNLQSLANEWIHEPPVGRDPQTKSYAGLIFTFALARLGETARCHENLREIAKTLSGRDLIHDWIFEAFSLRIQQALAGEASQGQLSEELLQQLETMDRMDRYILDRIRQRSRILEPHIRIDPYRNWHGRYVDELSRELAMLQNVVDGEQLSTRIVTLMKKRKSAPDMVRVLPVVLQLSPRVGEKFACSLLDRVPAAIEKCRDPMDQALLLQRALHVAANYGRSNLVQEFVASLIAALPAIFSEYLELELQNPQNKEKTEAAESLLSQSFRGLRKLGMRDEIGQMYGTVADLVASHEAKAAKSKRSRDRPDQASRAQRLLLCIAGGYYYFGEEREARKIVDKVRILLRRGGLRPVDQKDLTCAYLNAVSQAPINECLERVAQIFSVDNEAGFPRISDSMTTCSHFSISQLDVVEAAVMSLISDDFSLSGEARRWLDEDEFLVRSRIHREMRLASGG